jgi:hypothetical protein
MSDDERYLQILSIFHYLLAGLLTLGGCLPMFHLAAGIALLSGEFPGGSHGGPAPEMVGWMFTVVAIFLIVSAWTLAVCAWQVARNLALRSGYFFCLIVAGVECVFMPLGTVLGIFTILVLLRPGVKTLFGQRNDEPPSW